MGLLSKSTPKADKPSLSKEELEFLLKLIGDSKFDGHDVQMVYSTAVKLQQIITG